MPVLASLHTFPSSAKPSRKPDDSVATRTKNSLVYDAGSMLQLITVPSLSKMIDRPLKLDGIQTHNNLRFP